MIKHLIFGMLIRLILVAYSEWHDSNFTLKYSDIDYTIFTDAANHMINGSSPFDRHTYRYTPLLAAILTPNAIWSSFGKLIFSIFDLLTAIFIFKTGSERSIFWFYNPFSIAIATRGNADSVMTTLTTAFVYFMAAKRYNYAACCYGYAVHFKLYPVIYAPAILLHLIKKPAKLIKFGLFGAFFSVVPTLISYGCYGDAYINEALLYHVSRKDIRHNFSPYFYLLYLTDQLNLPVLNVALFAPQLILIVAIAIKYKDEVAFCCLATTFVFVCFNKVVTSQYFVWFLCYLPPIRLDCSRGKLVVMATVWALGQAVWLYYAYLLEMKGENTFMEVWVAAILFLSINLSVLNEFVKCFDSKKKKM